jgi:hypothetical protein
MRSLKLEFFQNLSGHEHWLPLCLPLLTDKAGGVMRSDSSILSGEQAVGQKGGGFLAKFFAQIFSTYSAIQESTEADRC